MHRVLTLSYTLPSRLSATASVCSRQVAMSPASAGVAAFAECAALELQLSACAGITQLLVQVVAGSGLGIMPMYSAAWGASQWPTLTAEQQNGSAGAGPRSCMRRATQQYHEQHAHMNVPLPGQHAGGLIVICAVRAATGTDQHGSFARHKAQQQPVLLVSAAAWLWTFRDQCHRPIKATCCQTSMAAAV